MNKKIALLALTGLVLAGCQNLEDQLGNKLAESLINSSTGGEVKVNIQDLKNGKMTVQTKDGTINMTGGENGGSLTMTDKNGTTVMNASGDANTLVVKDANGKTVMNANDKAVVMTDESGKTATFKSDSNGSKPEGIPADMPSIDGSNFNFFTYGGTTSVTFEVADADFKAVCQKQIAVTEGAGWTMDANGMTLEGSDTILKAYSKGNETLALSCGLNDGKTTLGLQKLTKTT